LSPRAKSGSATVPCSRLGAHGEEEFATRCERAGERLRELGATFPLPDDPEGQDRILPADWIPRIIPKDHREILSTGSCRGVTP
jgi:uncharacterized circularly permuted ATP-grasp superfamily protein